MRTKRLQRQLKKAFGDDTESSVVATFASANGEAAGNFTQFLDAVEQAYGQLEERVTLTQRSMEISAAELTESNSRLFRINQTFHAMLDSLGQGFLLFGPDGACLDISSKACEDLLETNPSGKHVADVLGVPAHKKTAFQGWMRILFEDKIDFTEFAKLGPNHFVHTKSKKISIEYRPVRGSDGQIDFVMVIATDFTSEFEARETAKEMRAHVNLVTCILRDKDRFIEFVAHSRKLMNACIALVGSAEPPEKTFPEIKRHIHTLKGSAGSFGMLAVQTKLHELETEIAKRETPASSAEFLKTEIPQLKILFERALEDNAHIIGDIGGKAEALRRVPRAKLAELSALLKAEKASSRASILAEELLAVPCTEIFARYESVVRDTATRLGKKIRRITFRGEEVRLMPENYEDVFESLDHIFRNILDHGIESAEERAAAGKSREGTIIVSVARVGEKVEFRINDDGRGINTVKVKRKLEEMGLAKIANGSREDVINAVFLPNLSTADTVSETSGRGTGMDVVKTSVEACGGSIWVESTDGKGTTFVIQLPVFHREWKELKGKVA